MFQVDMDFEGYTMQYTLLFFFLFISPEHTMSWRLER